MWRQTISALLIGTMLAATGCAQRVALSGAELMRGTPVDDVHVRTTDGYTYNFDRGYVRGDTFYGTLIEDVEEVSTEGDVYVTQQAREVPIPISSIVEVEQTRRAMSNNTIYMVGALGAGAIVIGALSDGGLSDVTARSTGNASKGPQ